MNWPEGLPRDNNELFRQYHKVVFNYIRNLNKVERNLEDIAQEIWKKLLESRVLDKFVESSRRRLPPTMIANDAAAYLGVSWSQWQNAMWTGARQEGMRKKANGRLQKRNRVWMPAPMEGTIYSRKAVFLTEDIVALGNGNFFKKRKPESERVQPPGVLSAKGFKSYLMRAVHNHFANWCRTKSRRHKEHTVAPMEDGTTWEAGLEDRMPVDSADLVDLATQIRDANLDLDTQEGAAILDIVASGYSLSEAVRKYDRQRAREQVRNSATVRTAPVADAEEAIG